MRVGIITSHPIQYQAPWFRGLAKEMDLQVFFAHRQSAAEQGKAGFGVAFDWDVDLLSGYKHRFLRNVSKRPSVDHFFGCDTPEIRGIIGGRRTGDKSDTSPNPLPGRGGEGNRARSPGSVDSSRVSSGQRPRRFDAFIVCGWNRKCYWQAVRACRRKGIPVLVRGDSQLLTPRSRLKTWTKEVLYRWMLRQFDGFLFVGQRNREYLRHYGVPEEKLFFAPHFVDNEWFKSKAAEGRGRRAEIRKEWGAGAKDFVALFVGKFIPKKRPTDLLRAMAVARNQRSEASGQEAIAVFVGAGDLENVLREVAAREELRVHFVGFKNQSELPAIYASADVLVLPSDGGETWGLVVNEAMACGLPAIVSDAIGCAPDLIEEGKTGLTYRVGKHAELADRLSKMAQMKQRGHDFLVVLAEKMRAYSVSAAVRGTLN
ncbi:MAG: glycosyltransferase family 4 protein, partial [Verrucomicrobia bacterium]|nr:glycosyltransferase family 4 protein [Verrucomicrobiota bacterium]